jgi:hypothetical protein
VFLRHRARSPIGVSHSYTKCTLAEAWSNQYRFAVAFRLLADDERLRRGYQTGSPFLAFEPDAGTLANC